VTRSFVAVARIDRLVNLASRARVGPAGNRTLIAGFVLGGGQAKRVLLRAVGPALAGFGVSGALPNPRLEVYDAAGLRILQNDDWDGAETAATAAQLGAFALPAGSRDAALLATLAPGAYTMQVLGGADTGVALVEIYDAGETVAATKLINLSTRGEVGTEENMLIGGFNITGNVPKQVFVRGIGPGLAAFGVGGTLFDPQVRVFRGSEEVAANDNWESGGNDAVVVAAAAKRAGAFALGVGSRDAAVLVTLAPGAYTAQVSGAGGGTGVALVEIYEVP
jgi:hypothetical protein